MLCLKERKIAFKDFASSQTFHNISMTVFTFFLVLFSFLTWLTIDKQTSISKELKEIQVYQNQQKLRLENQKILEQRKELKTIIENILGLFSPCGINERELHSKEDDIKLANIFYRNLYQGLDNFMLANNKECLKLWMVAINAVYLHASDYNSLPLEGLSDKEFVRMFMIHITKAYQSVFNVYIKFNLSHAAFENNEPKKENHNDLMEMSAE